MKADKASKPAAVNALISKSPPNFTSRPFHSAQDREREEQMGNQPAQPYTSKVEKNHPSQFSLDSVSMQHHSSFQGLPSSHRLLGPSSLLQPASTGQIIQRAVLLESHDYEGGLREPKIQTSDNFDKNHLVDGNLTNEIAENRLKARKTKQNTVVTKAALVREVTNNDRDLIDRAGTDTVTTYNFEQGEAKIASKGGVLHAPTIGLNARKINRGDIEIHHLHEADQKIDMGEFPALGSAK